jgi:hypothetical protein
MPHEVNMYPETEPKAPQLEESFSKLIKLASSFERNVWKEGFKELNINWAV